MRTIAFVLGDNDFGNTFRPLLESLKGAIAYNSALSKEDVMAGMSSGIAFHYITFQCGGRQPSAEMLQSTLTYLEQIQVLFDEEAEADILNKDWDHGAWYLEVASGTIQSY